MEDAEGDEVDIFVGDEVEKLEDDEEGSLEGDAVESLEGDVVERLVESSEIDEDEVACLVDDMEGIKDVLMEREEQEFESTNEDI